MATMLPKVLEMERHQLADYARVDYAITKGEDEVAALEELCLGPNELRREASVVRDRTVLAVREVRNNSDHNRGRHTKACGAAAMGQHGEASSLTGMTRPSRSCARSERSTRNSALTPLRVCNRPVPKPALSGTGA